MQEQLERLVKEWHEAGRKAFELKHPKLNYDEFYPKNVLEKRKYFYLDVGSCGAFMVDKESGDIFGIRAYGDINRKKLCGNVATITGEELLNQRWR